MSKYVDALHDILHKKNDARDALLELSFNDIQNLICLLHMSIDGHTEEELLSLARQYKDHLSDIRQMALDTALELAQRAKKLSGV